MFRVIRLNLDLSAGHTAQSSGIAVVKCKRIDGTNTIDYIMVPTVSYIKGLPWAELIISSSFTMLTAVNLLPMSNF